MIISLRRVSPSRLTCLGLHRRTASRSENDDSRRRPLSKIKEAIGMPPGSLGPEDKLCTMTRLFRKGDAGRETFA